MTELANQGASSAKRLVLGFDAGCMTCSELARRIEEQVGDKLEVRSLWDPQVEEWRKRALGEDTPWVPTLIEIKGLKVRAWTGKRMGLTLGRSLGPVATWRVLQVLGELGTVQEAEESSIGALVVGMSRGQFLKGVGGAVVAMSVLSGGGKLASTALAAGNGSHSGNLSVVSVKELTGNDLIEATRKGVRSQDMLNVGPGSTWSDDMQSGAVSKECEPGSKKHKKCATFICHDPAAGCSSYFDSKGNLVVAKGSTAIKAANHKYSDGNTKLAISFILSGDRVYHYWEYEQSVNGIKTEAGKWRPDHQTPTLFRRTGFSANDHLSRRPQEMSRTQSLASTQQYDCGVYTNECGCCTPDAPYLEGALPSRIDTECILNPIPSPEGAGCGEVCARNIKSPFYLAACELAACSVGMCIEQDTYCNYCCAPQRFPSYIPC
jgi:hypothetical protein